MTGPTTPSLLQHTQAEANEAYKPRAGVGHIDEHLNFIHTHRRGARIILGVIISVFVSDFRRADHRNKLDRDLFVAPNNTYINTQTVLNDINCTHTFDPSRLMIRYTFLVLS